MIRLTFASPQWNAGEGRIEFRRVADVWISGQEVHVEGDPSVFSTDVRVVEPQTGALLTFDADPERWARALPTAYRAGDLEVTALVEIAAPASVAYA